MTRAVPLQDCIRHAGRHRPWRGRDQGSSCAGQGADYVVIAIDKITDADAYKPLPAKGRAAAEAAGGRYLISTGNITRLDGRAPERFALIEFEDVAKAEAWYASGAQKEADAIRAKSTDSTAFIVEGIAR